MDGHRKLLVYGMVVAWHGRRVAWSIFPAKITLVFEGTALNSPNVILLRKIFSEYPLSFRR
jgi:hypothetical protein